MNIDDIKKNIVLSLYDGGEAGLKQQQLQQQQQQYEIQKKNKYNI